MRKYIKLPILFRLAIFLFSAGLLISYYSEFLAVKDNGIFALLLGAIFVLLTAIFLLAEPNPKKKYYPVLLLFVFLMVPLLLTIGVEFLNGNMLWDINYAVNAAMNYLLCLLLEVAWFALAGSVRISAGITTVLMSIFGIVNMYCKAYKGSPLLPWDITSIVTAANVAGTFQFEITCSVVLMILIDVTCFTSISALPMRKKKTALRKAARVLSIVLTGVFCFIFWGTDIVATEFGAAPDFFNQTRGYENNGAWAEFMVNTRYLKLGIPSGYDSEVISEEITSRIDPEASILKSSGLPDYTPAEETPDIVVIMNESFSDLRVIGDFDTNIEVMPYIDSLIGQENVIQGSSYVSTIGTGTSNTEYEFLTGNPMAFLPAGSNAYQLYVTDSQPGLTSVLKSQGYSADALHPYNSSSWNRVAVYNAMEFDSFTTISDLKNVRKLRRFASDEYDFEQIRNMYEARDPDQPFFLFNITMQNHSSYEKKYENFEERVALTGMQGEYPLTDQYLSLIRETDDRFKELIEYFEKADHPVVVLMFGDHQPFIENSFYEEVMGQKLSAMSDETAQKRYITRFILWANYDIPEGWIDQISVNYLSALLTEITGTEKTDYLRFLETIYDEVPVITQLGCIDRNGVYFKAEDSNDFEDDLRLYRKAAYNNLIDNKHRSETLFSLTK